MYDALVHVYTLLKEGTAKHFKEAFQSVRALVNGNVYFKNVSVSAM